MKEVYVAKGLNNEVLYVGQGNIGRNLHCVGGTSHNKDLNRYFFKNGEDGCIITEVLHVVETQEEASALEKELILKLKPNYNIVRYIEQDTTYKFRNFGFSAKAYVETEGKDDFVVENIKKYHPMLFTYVDELGIECLKTCGFQESKLKKKFMSFIGAKELESNSVEGVLILDIV